MKSSFFKPYVGSKYSSEGFHGKKVLVLGASFYCVRKECPFFLECTDEDKKDSSEFDAICPEYNKTEHLLLSDCPTYEIEGGNVYARFGNSMSRLFFESRISWEDFWEMVAFTNYVQFILPHWQTYKSDVSERDKQALIEVVDTLNPDIIIVWGCVVNDYVKGLAYDDDVKLSTGGYLCHWNHNGKNIAIVNPYHPISPIYYSNSSLNWFEKTLRIALSE